MEWNSNRLGGHAHGIVTKTVHKTMPGVLGVSGSGECWGLGSIRDVGGVRGLGVLGVSGV